MLDISYAEAMTVNLDNQNPHIAGFLKRNHVAVLATASKDSSEPHAAAVYFDTDSNLNVYFLTKEKTLKCKNLMSNPQAAMAVYESDTQRTAQINGPVEVVDDKEGMAIAQRIMAKFSQQGAGSEETPISKLDAGDYVLFRLRPQSIRLAEYRYGEHNSLFDVAVPSEESLEN